jgi:hypothetical protein
MKMKKMPPQLATIFRRWIYCSHAGWYYEIGLYEEKRIDIRDEDNTIAKTKEKEDNT